MFQEKKRLEENSATGDQLRELGNYHFKKLNFDTALKLYENGQFYHHYCYEVI